MVRIYNKRKFRAENIISIVRKFITLLCIGSAYIYFKTFLKIGVHVIRVIQSYRR